MERDLNSWAVGCYTSQIRVKQKHREAEGTLSAVEKMLSQAALRGLLPYPEKELKEAQEALLFSEFHDILPGSSIQSVEEASLQMLDHSLEILNYWKRRAFFALLSGEKKAEEGEYPILIYNPHPYPVEGIFPAISSLPTRTGANPIPCLLSAGTDRFWKARWRKKPAT